MKVKIEDCQAVYCIALVHTSLEKYVKIKMKVEIVIIYPSNALLLYIRALTSERLSEAQAINLLAQIILTEKKLFSTW